MMVPFPTPDGPHTTSGLSVLLLMLVLVLNIPLSMLIDLWRGVGELKTFNAVLRRLILSTGLKDMACGKCCETNKKVRIARNAVIKN